MLIASMMLVAGFASVEEPAIRQIVVYEGELCPESSAREIFICTQKTESERYRLRPVIRPTDVLVARVRGGPSVTCGGSSAEKAEKCARRLEAQMRGELGLPAK